MTVMDSDRLVNEYVESLARAARSLSRERREELSADVRSHVAESGATTEAEVRNVLERLGSVEEIVAGYGEEQASVPRAEPRLRLREYAALLLLPFGGFVFVVGWFAGVALLWASDRWRTGEKVLGTLLLPFGYLPVMLATVLQGRSCTGLVDQSDRVIQETCTGVGLPPSIDTPLFVLLAIVPVVSMAVLAKRAAPNRA